MSTLNLNKAAVSAFGTAEKIRVKLADGVMFVRPTARKAGANLPKGEKLVSLTKNGNSIRATVDIDGAEGNYGLVANKYGWYALAGEPGKNAPAIRVGA